MKKRYADWFFYLALFGTFLSVVTVFLPWFGISPDLLASSGDIAGGIASTFGLAVAAIALKLYVWSESPEKKRIDILSEQLDVVKIRLQTLSKLYRAIIQNQGTGYSSDDIAKGKSLFLEILQQFAKEEIKPEFVAYAESAQNGLEDAITRFVVSAMMLSDNDLDALSKKDIGNLTGAAKLFIKSLDEFDSWAKTQDNNVIRSIVIGK